MRVPASPWIRAFGLLGLTFCLSMWLPERVGARSPVHPTEPAQGQELPYEELAKAWRETHGVPDVEGSEDPFEDFQPLLELAFCKVRIGVFDVHLARDFMRDKQQAQQFRDVCLALIDLQSKWIELFGKAGKDNKAVRADLDKLRKWMARARITKKAMSEPSGDLIEFLGGGQRERELADSTSQAMISGQALGFAVRRERPAQVIFSPTRRDFVCLSSYIGWLDQPWRGAYWIEDVLKWTEFYWNDLQVIALQYPPFPATESLEEGIAMDEREHTGLLQHVVQRATHSLCWYAFARTLDPAFESGLAQDMVIEIYGENNARSGGNGRGSQNDGWSMFVPGGQSQGGVLPKNNADSVWRLDLGADHFVKVLKLAQREGGKEARKASDKLPYFEITHDNGSGKMIIRGPFLGVAASEKALPPEPFLGDYREFFRAYKTCFAYWMHTYGAGAKKKESQAKFLELMTLVAADVPDEEEEEDEDRPAPGESFEAQVQEVYGQPWSAPEGDPENLEWRFLAWLARQ